METITYGKITEDNFSPASLDGFVRRQEVKECWRKADGRWKLLPVAYVEDWDLPQRRRTAEQVLLALRQGGLAWGAWAEDAVAGFALVAASRFGSAGQYAALEELEVSRPWRRRGIGAALFRLACDGARTLGASKLYISAHSARESMAAYRKYGCVEAEEPDPAHVEKEPCDVQLEYRL